MDELNQAPDEDQIRQDELSVEQQEIALRRQQANQRAQAREYNKRAVSLHVDDQTLGFSEGEIVNMELQLRKGEIGQAERMVNERKADFEARRKWLDALDRAARGNGSYAEAERLKADLRSSPWVTPKGFQR